MELISRNEVLDYLKIEIGFWKHEDEKVHKAVGIIEFVIEELPIIESRPKGEWIKNEFGWYFHCSVCKENNLLHTDEANALSNYCPHCGADMRGEENVND